MMAYILWDVEPQVFSGFSFLRWYGISWIMGLVLGYHVLLTTYKKEGWCQQDLDKLAIYTGIGAIIGARLGHILFYDFVFYLNHPWELLPFRIYPTFQFVGFAGLASHGGVLGAIIALYLYVKKYKKEFLPILDRLAIAGVLLGSMIRLGNFMNSEIIGIPTNVPWAIIFERIDKVPRHPTQIYEAAFYLVVFLVLYHFWRSQKVNKYKGFLFGLGLALIFIQRFFIEIFKENQVSFEDNLLFNMGQFLSLPFILLGVGIMVMSYKKYGQVGRKRLW